MFVSPVPMRSHYPRKQVEDVVSLVSQANNVPKHLILHEGRCFAKASRARQLSMYLCHVVLGRTLVEVGLTFRRDRTTVSYACGVIEDLRDDPVFDAQVSLLESRLEQDDMEISHVAA